MPQPSPTYLVPSMPPYTNISLDEAIDRMMTCATAERCAREESCFRVVMWAKEQREKERTRRAVAVEPGEVAHYAPQWEGSIGVPAVDWDAA